MVYKFFEKKSKAGDVNIPLDFKEKLAKRITQADH